MKRSQVLLLAVALVTGGLAAYLVLGSGGNRPAEQAQVKTEVVAEPKTQILVAARDIGVGERLAADSVQWQDWPEGAVRPEYVTIAAAPDAATDIKNAVARFEFFAGEPIRDAKLARSDQGYLSAVLSPGMRGVSVTVTPESGSGGFIVPNDHVDVVVTRSGEAGDISETILSNVKVLAIGKRLGEVGATAGNPDPNDPASKTFDAQTVATLELDPIQSESLINASSTGRLSLVLRSVVDFVASGAPEARRNQAISIIRFGTKANVMAGSATGDVALGSTGSNNSSLQ
ncbi:Flp pilus assembly protein CpaB [Youhaiella tibetensis]|uniref:Flp pilus assembly protein CpaB n=1 Tax=Paradevosia tibetensis TaxID=1447062 RepID=A0A5B9DIT8_9HYPH|nr:Flp pilus assembly protein CpaB [Youhaiella tibetensis]QEE18752.1 Flp pilus assembly protein CpaB [Youhaiella tibetensis]GGF39531.1 Flp pilus assembly protein CpaB [Youhaiella tibetensis]